MAIGDLSDNAPTILGCTPSFKIDSYEAAVAHYVEWLGFSLDWEWRAEPEQPLIKAISRVEVSNLQGLADEWNQRGPGSVEVFLEQPYEILTAYVRDPFGNMMALQQPQTEADAADIRANAHRIRKYLDDLVKEDAMRPTPQQIVDEVSGSLGVASEVLADFKEWKRNDA